MRKLLKTFSVLAFFALGLTANAASFRTVVIDPGHGGHDKGGQWGRVYEKHLALDTSMRLEAHLKSMGYKTIVTRRSDYFISLPQRVAIANRQKDAIFVSVHYNYTWKQEVSGIETFYNRPDSSRLSSLVQSSILKRVRATDRSSKYARYYVIRHTNIPSILVECGFVSCKTERDRMKSAWFRDSLARGIADGIQRFNKGG
jgi:N-acetylmuramoyl-L-alanine amidase